MWKTFRKSATKVWKDVVCFVKGHDWMEYLVYDDLTNTKGTYTSGKKCIRCTKNIPSRWL